MNHIIYALKASTLRHAGAEARLCNAAAPNAAPTLADSIGSTVSDFTEYASGVVSWMTGELVQQCIKIGTSVPSGIWQGLKNSLKSDPTSLNENRLIQLLDNALTMIRMSPMMMSILGPTAEQITNANTLENILSFSKWAETFREHPDIFSRPKQPIDYTQEFGPYEFLLSLNEDQRKTLYVQFVDALIPQEVQEDHSLPTSGRLNDRFNALAAVNSGVPHALGAILGVENWQGKRIQRDTLDKATGIARDSLQSYYVIDPKSPSVSRGLQDDYIAALKKLPSQNLHSFVADADALSRHIGDSRFRGALKMGVVDNAQLQKMAHGISTLQHEVNLSKANIANHLDRFMGTTKEQMKQQTETLVEAFNSMPPAVKMLVLGATIYGIVKSKVVRGISIALLAGYVSHRVLFKEKHPTEKWSEWLNSMVGTMKSGSKSMLGREGTTGFINDLEERTNVSINFLDDYSMEHLEQQSIGMGILFDVPLSQLARCFAMNGPGGADMYLNIHDPFLSKTIREALKARHLSETKFAEFFRDPSSTVQVGEAMSYVFFSMAASRRENEPKVRYILEQLRRLPPGTSISVFAQSSRMSENAEGDIRQDIQRHMQAHRLYVELVAAGRAMAMGEQTSLGQYMEDAGSFDFLSDVSPDTDIDMGVAAVPIPAVGGTAITSTPASGSPSVSTTPSSGSNTTPSPSSGSSAPSSTPSSSVAAPGTPSTASSPAATPSSIGSSASNAPSTALPSAPSTPAAASVSPTPSPSGGVTSPSTPPVAPPSAPSSPTAPGAPASPIPQP